MSILETQLGRIFYKYDKSTNAFDKIRILNISQSDNSNENIYTLKKLDNNYNLIDPEINLSTKDFSNFIKTGWTPIQSSGIVTITNVVAAENEVHQIRDVVLIFFPNNKVTKCPHSNQPYVVARQAIDNIFDPSGSSVGMSVSIDSLPTGYSLSDFLENTSVKSSKMSLVYEIDTAKTLSEVLCNNETKEILEDLYAHQYIQRFVHNDPLLENDADANRFKQDCLNGYYNTLEGFMFGTGFIDDIMQTLGIAKVDFELKSNQPLTIDQMCFVSILYGGIKINKAVPIQFDYDIDLNYIKMKYLLLRDLHNITWIVPYTTSPDEVDAAALYNLTDEKYIDIQERLSHCSHVYLNSKK